MKKVLFVFIMFVVLGISTGTNYYFADAKNGGSAINDGLTPATPKNSYTAIPATLNPDDSVLTKCGSSMWYQTITVPSSGTNGHPIVFGKYGTGNKPIINGGAYLNGWVNYSGNVYAAQRASNPDGPLYLPLGKVKQRDSTLLQLLSDTTTGAWYWDDPKDTLYMVFQSAPENNSVLIKSIGNCILINGKSHITIQDYELRGPTSNYVILAMGSGIAITGLTIQRIDIPYSNREGMYFINTTCYLQNCNIKNCWNGVYYGSTYGTPSGVGVSLIGSYSNSNVIRRNNIENCYQGIYTEGGTLNDSMYLNVITNSVVNGINMSNNAKTNPTKVYNNVIIHNPLSTSGHGIVVQGSGAGGAIIKNNIIYSEFTGQNTNVQCIALLNDTATSVNNNCYYLKNGSTAAIGKYISSVYFSLSDWISGIASSGIKEKDSLSISTNPQLSSLFIPASNDCLISGTNVGLTTDYFGNTIPALDNVYPIGIYSGLPTPTPNPHDGFKKSIKDAFKSVWK